ncbi:MAG: butyrate kinase [Deltaproteobacteria bacterium]|jgi:butyrate kinase|nr:butyrate kinase [Deltaproteobacteria bacterium]
MADNKYLILAINPGSTSTKFAVFENDKSIFEKTVRHPPEDFAKCVQIKDQKNIRLKYIMDALKEKSLGLEAFQAVVARGGITAPVPSGTYDVNEKMLHDLTDEKGGASAHASCLGGIIAADIAKNYKIPAFIVDPVVVDELIPEARISGIPEIERKPTFHALNTKAVARLIAKQMGMNYNEARLVVVHMGGGVTIGAHRYGKVIDVNNAVTGEGPFSPERSGALPAAPLIEMCFSGKYTKDQLLAFLQKSGGIKAYLNTNDMRDVEKLSGEGDAKATLLLNAMAYQIAKEVGAMVAALEGRVDAIILTGGIAYSNLINGLIKKYVDRFAPVRSYPGELEMEALAWGALRILRGEEKPSVYTGKNIVR